ncbi:ABC-type metal ion transport system, periplasmic component/surface adhesin [Clostridium pasteurianum DSM 525 = ATCC 6013]|uniref:ABC-type metal ion transport system, periplasmic component/surface adhesin n=1 Tax=Clostridium pasteurianum DSM 525 = ATCC 6013 TaxID=1262449 RepID=A0A0H3J6D6_CLOPA|nr:metal ABC transporter substrate-binding protein [Clostridium pasteurianum]AJA49566.1 ABC-type metal ion transport system, periplasmic component/surface adhesin [Clostridium pasteurianum DSM 525 = ATCC 6013]AJA53554.1 ABC-type metal ion transport system, periplasmic component/surface adhesin [Clostridium pasteurianum DSM 525 = ATCC 6013]AOZ76720.1 zinc-binding protein [Clostridium pasteurianum DSM 525 = ATCC 6013]AOZ80517.1 zinc-binding protein [Clostridium pasteurianum]ELP58918.1 Zn-binding
MKKIMCLFLLFTIIIFQNSCNKNTNINSNTENTKKVIKNLDVMVSNKYLYNIVRDIAGDKNNLEFMLKNENEKFTYTEDSISNVGKQDLFIYIGAGFEEWAEDFLNNVDKSKVSVINSSRGISFLTYGNKNAKNYGQRNPYYMMDINNYKTMLLNIKNAIEEKDPKNRSTYEANFRNCITKVDEYRDSMKDISNKMKDYTIITDTDRFDYLLSSQNFNNIKFYRNDQGYISSEDNQRISIEKDKGKKLCFIYDDDKDLQQNKDIIDRYAIQPIKVTVYNADMDYVDMLKSNIESFKSVIK